MLLPFEQKVSGCVLVLFPELYAVEGVVGRTFFFPGLPWVIHFVLSFDIFFLECLLDWIKKVTLLLGSTMMEFRLFGMKCKSATIQILCAK